MSDATENTGDDIAIAIGLFVVWVFSLLFFSDYAWWYSFPFVILFAVAGAMTSPIIKALTAYIFAATWTDTGLPHWATVVAWPLLLPLTAMAAFFVLMGRLAR